jgi:photosystem II stability/assembly factor-like uncharacterized protein
VWTVRKLCLILAFISTLALPASSGQWEQLPFPRGSPTVLLSTPQGLYASSFGRIYLSKDNAQTWDSLSSVRTGSTDLILVGEMLLSTSFYARPGIDIEPLPCVFRSRDYGRSWDSLLAALFGSPSLMMCGPELYANPDGKLFVSSDTGTTWTRIDSLGTFPGLIAEVTADGSALYVMIQTDSMYANKLYRSTNRGTSWTDAGAGLPSNFLTVTAHGDSVYVATSRAEFFMSRDHGNSWRAINSGLPDSSGFWSLFLVGNTLLASISEDFYQTVYQLDSSDSTWRKFDDGLQLPQKAYIYDFAASGEYIFLGTEGAVWRRPLTDLNTAMKQPQVFLPDGFSLSQNYPNPFNPSTTIKFELPKSSMVQLSVYDILGREVSVLVNERKNAGSYHVRFDGAGLSSGVYFYRIKTGDFTQTRKLCLIR